MSTHKKRRFRFKQFQLEDLARAALVDRVILSWEPGMGKTLAAIAWAIIKGARRVLLVVPGQLHRNFRNEAREKFGRHITSLSHRHQLHGFKLNKPLPTSTNLCRFFITTFHELGYNHTRDGSPSLADCIAKLIAKGAGFDCVIVDEGTRLQNEETHISTGVRKLNPKLRMLLTGTPVKNRLESFFHLAAWVAGDNKNGESLWPYPATSKARDQFTRDFLMSVRSNGSTERTARITNTHRLWRLIAPIMIRRRKTECGEDIVPKIVKPIVLQPGTFQAEVYRNHLFYPPLLSSTGRPLHGFGRVAVQLNYLRQAALAPHSASLGRVHSVATGLKKSPTVFNPKFATCLSIAADVVRARKQLIIGSPFRAFSHSLHAYLRAAGVSSLLLDGNTSPDRRGLLAEQFKNGRYAVLVVGVAAMSEGFDFDNCSHLILPSLSWAYDENEQFVNRVWRITSKKPVTIYLLSITGTIDERLAELFAEKSATAQLALDGRLIGDQIEDVDLADLLRHSIKSFHPGAETLDETGMETQWPTLKNQLALAEARYRKRKPRLKILVTKNLPQPLPTSSTKIDWKSINRIVKSALAA
jgi:SNF2 family DNA or RNA helicase